MNRFRLLATGIMLVIALTASAQQPATAAANPESQARGQAAGQSTVSNVDQHLKLLSEKLDLTVHQQAQIKPILQQMFDSRQKLMHDTSLSDEAREEKERALHELADKQARQYLNNDQKSKLDGLERQPHP